MADKTSQQIEEEKYELRIINRDLQREQEVERLKKKHMISGTIKEQKAQVRQKRRELNDPDPEDDEQEDMTAVEPVIETGDANNILDPQPTEEGTA